MAGLSAFPPGFGNFFQDKARREGAFDHFAIPTQLGEPVFADTVELRPSAHALQPDGVAINPGEHIPAPKKLVTTIHVLGGDLISVIFV
jgi:hypothetical protein